MLYSPERNSGNIDFKLNYKCRWYNSFGMTIILRFKVTFRSREKEFVETYKISEHTRSYRSEYLRKLPT